MAEKMEPYGKWDSFIPGPDEHRRLNHMLDIACVEEAPTVEARVKKLIESRDYWQRGYLRIIKKCVKMMELINNADGHEQIPGELESDVKPDPL